MSSYFVNSFSGRYPNGSDYQLLNYGTNGAVSGSFRDPGNMHPGSFGYNYNGMDLTVNRASAGNTGGTGTGHFGAAREDARGYRQSPGGCSLSSPDSVHPNPNPHPHPLPAPPPVPVSSCASVGRDPLELKSPSPPPQHPDRSSGLNKASANALFTEIEDPVVAGATETEEGARGSGSASRAQQQQQQEPHATSSSTPTPNDCQTPQIFPWMRKLHISHARAPL
ncbi:unnamed protein product [Menidia menidia]|uniref:(Atlantic silverside) hypothetical protein n=1 Tax=Menidia menidia TaxID=238744 RepID=A0A8S4B739_9TELE|nr:unnamed protein product [Menidia menidia]